MPLNKDMEETLEVDFLDQSALTDIIESLAAIAWEKADHVRSNWQDENMARSWERDAKKLDTLSAKLEN